MPPRPCILCGHQDSEYQFASDNSKVVRCVGCDLLRREPALPLDAQPGVIEKSTRTEQLAAEHYIRCLKDQGLDKAEILYFGLSEGEAFCQELTKAGYKVTKAVRDLKEICEEGTRENNHVTKPGDEVKRAGDRAAKQDFEIVEMDEDEKSQQKFDCVIFYQTLERSPDASQQLLNIREHLKDDGIIMLVSVCLDTWAAKAFGRHWIGWYAGLNYFFSRATLQLLLEKTGFHNILQLPDIRNYTLEHVGMRIENLAIGPLFKPFLSITPASIKQKDVRIPSSAKVAIARKTDIPTKHKLSIIMPVFNEKNTFMESFEAIHQRVLNGIDRIDEAEIIIVESNSNDGSRELVQSVASDHVKIVLEEKPRGKGHAVRTGLKHATGNICVIQDADLEYDVNDYDALVKPITEYRKTFVLGTRHAGDWKIRKFANEAFSAMFLNFGHILFTTIINVFFHQNLTDPFTMYKVFRRECLYKLKFECNRFDFDHELLIKLVQKGYTPVEIPVNYKSRGFGEGKKVTVIRDPITWIIADIKYLFVSPFEEDYLAIGTKSQPGRDR